MLTGNHQSRLSFKLLFVVWALFLIPTLMAADIQDFNLPVFNSDKEFSLKEARKEKLIVLNFWASWCTACIKEIPELEELKKKYSNKADFYAVNAGDKESYVKRFVKKHNFTYTVLWDKDKSLSKKLDILELPRTIVVNQQGKTIYDSNRPPKEL